MFLFYIQSHEKGFYEIKVRGGDGMKEKKQQKGWSEFIWNAFCVLLGLVAILFLDDIRYKLLGVVWIFISWEKLK